MELRGAVGLRCAHIGDRREDLGVHRDALGGIRRLSAGLADHCGNRLSDMAHGAARECKARRLGHRTSVARLNDPERPHGLDAVRRHVASGEHGNDAQRGDGSGCVDPANSRVRMRRAHKHAVQGAVSRDVGHEAPAAEQKPAILDAAERRANALVMRAYSISSRTKSTCPSP